MRRVLVSLGIGASLIAAHACAPAPVLPLALAASRNAVDRVRALLERGAAADASDAGGLTPLMWAARSGAVDAMAVLLDAGADPNARDARHRWTPLLHAVHRRQPAAVRLLLDRGADPNVAARGLLTPLMMAADDPDASNVQALLASGADPHIVGPGGMTALTQAVSGGAFTDLTDRPLFGGCRPDAVRALLAHDAKLGLPDNFAGRQALWWARLNGCDEVVRLVDRVFETAGLPSANARH
jgi:ankyrin repeat protein